MADAVLRGGDRRRRGLNGAVAPNFRSLWTDPAAIVMRACRHHAHRATPSRPAARQAVLGRRDEGSAHSACRCRQMGHRRRAVAGAYRPSPRDARRNGRSSARYGHARAAYVAPVAVGFAGECGHRAPPDIRLRLSAGQRRQGPRPRLGRDGVGARPARRRGGVAAYRTGLRLERGVGTPQAKLAAERSRYAEGIVRRRDCVSRCLAARVAEDRTGYRQQSSRRLLRRQGRPGRLGVSEAGVVLPRGRGRRSVRVRPLRQASRRRRAARSGAGMARGGLAIRGRRRQDSGGIRSIQGDRCGERGRAAGAVGQRSLRSSLGGAGLPRRGEAIPRGLRPAPGDAARPAAMVVADPARGACRRRYAAPSRNRGVGRCPGRRPGAARGRIPERRRAGAAPR